MNGLPEGFELDEDTSVQTMTLPAGFELDVLPEEPTVQPIEEEERKMYVDYLLRAYPESGANFAKMSTDQLRQTYRAERAWATQEEAVAAVS